MERTVKEKMKFFYSLNKDLNIESVGFNDFKFLSAIKSFRKLALCNFHFVKEGKGKLFIEDKVFDVSAGDCFFLFTNHPVMYYPSDNNPWSYYWLDLSGEKAEIFGKAMGFSPESPIKKIKNHKVFEKFEKILSGNVSENSASCLAMSLFYENMSYYASGEKKTNADYGITERIKAILDLNYLKSDFTVEVAVETGHVSHSYLCKLFKERYKITAKEYLIELRLGKATEIIKSDKDATVKEIAYRSGFNDEFHFMKLFKKRYGKTVKEFSRSI